MKHLVHVAGWNNSTEELVKNIGDMRYDALSEFMELLSEEFYRQSDGDSERGRKQLAEKLSFIAANLGSAAVSLNRAWEICKPYEIDNKTVSTSEEIPETPKPQLPNLGDTSYFWCVKATLPGAIPQPLIVVEHVIDKHLRTVITLAEWEESKVKK